MANFRLDMSVEEILKIMNRSEGHTETIHAGAVFLQYKLHDELLENQNTYNQKQLFWSRVLALATVGLVVATILLVKFG